MRITTYLPYLIRLGKKIPRIERAVSKIVQKIPVPLRKKYGAIITIIVAVIVTVLYLMFPDVAETLFTIPPEVH